VTEPAPQRPVPGLPRPVPGPVPGAPGPRPPDATAPAGTATSDNAPSPFTDLAARPVAEHVAVFEAEHERLQRELSTIDQL
jgi:hypothetical protein